MIVLFTNGGQNRKTDIKIGRGIGEFLLTSLFTYCFISIQLKSDKEQR